VKVYFLRHGIAVDAQEFDGDDFDRPLTKEGKDRIAREAKALAKIELNVDAIVTSPLVRAKQTAHVVAEALDLEKHLFADRRVDPGFNAGRLSEILRDREDAGAIMLVGHEPSMSSTIGEIVGRARIDLKKGGLACVELRDPASQTGTLQWLVPPNLLRRKL
jgi:phosphohistidine phosphatase